MKTFLCLVMLGFVKLQGSEKTEHLGDDLEPASNPRLRSKGPGTGTRADWTFCSAGAPCGHGQGDCDGSSQCKPGHSCGNNNCGDYNKDAHRLADCCVEPEFKPSWIQYGGSLMNVAVGPFGVWGVASTQVVWKKTASSWQQTCGTCRMTDISVGKNSLWGVNSGQQTYKRTGNGNWEQIPNPGKFNQISVSGSNDLNVWATDTDKQIHKWTGSGWEIIDGGLNVVSCGESGVWGVNNEDEVWYRKGTYGGGASAGTGWEQVDGLLTWISSGAAGEVWGTNKEGDVWKREGISISNPTGTGWTKVSSGSMKQVSIWGGQAWAVNNKDHVFVQ